MERLQARVTARRRGDYSPQSPWLDGREGLREAAEIWASELPAARAAIPRRVEHLTGPGHRVARLRRMLEILAVLVFELARFVFLDVPRRLVLRRRYAPAAAHRLRRGFEHLGPSYIKFGQFVSSGRGLFPEVLVEEFAACRDACPELPFRKIQKVVEAELGPLGEHFRDFEREPMSAASIAQVHAATLRDGTEVAVKVRRPRLERKVESHIKSMATVAKLVERFVRNAHLARPPELVRLFATTILEELDFRLEAQNMVDIACDLEAAGVDDVVVPRPMPGAVTPRVLVMERLDGLGFDDLEGMQAAGVDTSSLLLSGIRSLVEGATVFGRFHGDLHAANVICLRDGRFGLIDFGICARLSGDERAALQRLLLGIATRDVRGQVHALDLLGAIPPGVDRRALIARLVSEQHGREVLSVDDLRDGAPRVMGIFVEHRLRLPKGLVVFFKDVLYLNGSTRLLAPHLNLLSTFVELHRYFDGKYGPGRVEVGEDPYGEPIADHEIAGAVPQGAEPEAAPPPTLRSLARRFGRRGLTDAIGPLTTFLVLNTFAGLRWAMAGATAWAVGLAAVRRGRGVSVGPLLPIVVGLILLRGTAGIITRSAAVYFGPGIANNFLIAGVFALSVVVRRPLVGTIARALYPFPDEVRRHPAFRRIFGRLTVAWAAFIAGMGLLQVWLIANVSTNTFLVTRAAVGWPVGIALLVYSLRYPRKAFARVPDFTERVTRAEAVLRGQRG